MAGPHGNRFALPDLGLGLGLRSAHYGHVLETRPPVDWFELLTENYLDTGGRPRRVAAQVAECYPVVLHGVSLSIGSTDPLDTAYLRKLKALADALDVVWLGDHVCWTGVAGRTTHDLLPVPYTEQALAHVVGRIREVQDLLGRPLVLENPSTYATFRDSHIPEPVFLRRMAEDADCALLLDVNNVHVTCRNHGLDPWVWLGEIPMDRVVQVHLAGHKDKGTHYLDTHDRPVCDEVWALYAEVMERTGGVATLLEWDADIPPFEDLMAELRKAARFRKRALSDP